MLFLKEYMSILVYYDGTNITKYGRLDFIAGFTTNTSFMAQSNKLNYRLFYNTNAKYIQNKPISFQVFTDDDDVLGRQARAISSIGDNVFVKIPVIKSDGRSNMHIIRDLLHEGIKVNITAVFTVEQSHDIYTHVQGCCSTPFIVSVFAGRIADTGINPFETVQRVCDMFRDMRNAQILWAGCKDIASIPGAQNAGCHIITIPDAVLDRIDRKGKDLTVFSKETVAAFNADAIRAGITID